MTPNNRRDLNKTVGLNRGLLLSYKEFLKFSTTLYSSATAQKRLPFCISSPILCAKTIWYRYLYLLCAVLFYFHLKNLLFFSNAAVKATVLQEVILSSRSYDSPSFLSLCLLSLGRTEGLFPRLKTPTKAFR